jgi:hypothetical protein
MKVAKTVVLGSAAGLLPVASGIRAADLPPF